MKATQLLTWNMLLFQTKMFNSVGFFACILLAYWLFSSTYKAHINALFCMTMVQLHKRFRLVSQGSHLFFFFLILYKD